tara:strand:+ start:198 stop:1070 length:873 start_codon:yes stop_codon:yes gene_type:complete
MPPKITDLRKLARGRSSLLRTAEKGLLSRATTMQRKLNAYVMRILMPSLQIKNNKLVNSSVNLRKINKASGLKSFMHNVIDLAMFEYYDKQFNAINKVGTKYYTEFAPSESTVKGIINRGKISTDGFTDELFDNNQIVKQLQDTVRKNIITETSTVDVTQLLTEQIKGKNDKFGVIKSYHYQNGYDKMQNYSRQLDTEFSKALKLNYAIYAGGEIQTTRDFCESRNGNVYNRETILSWNNTPATWAGRKPQNDILIDMGGYNCRHDFDWISYALARRIDPNIEKSEFDTK